MDIFGGQSADDTTSKGLDHNAKAAILAFIIVLVVLLIIQQIILAVGNVIATFFHDLFNSDVSYAVMFLLSSGAAFLAYSANDNKSISDRVKSE